MSVAPLTASGVRPEFRMDDVRPALIVNAEIVRCLLPEFDQVSITVVDSTGNAFTCAQAGGLAGDLDRLQYGLGEGPCIDSIQGDVRVVAPDIRRDDRWSRYVSSAAELGLRAQLAAPLRSRGDAPMGALNLYSTTRRDIPATAPLIAEALAAQVAGVLDTFREIENLHRALATRRTIGIAVGLLMAEYQLSESAAFAVLERRSSHTNARVRDIAARMVADGNAAGVVSADDTWFQLTFVAPGGRIYETTLQAPSDVEAVRLADLAFGDDEHIRIHDFLDGDGLTVRPPARLHVERVQAHQAVPGLGLVITDPDGTVTRR